MMVYVILASTCSINHRYEEAPIQTFRVNIQVSVILVMLNGIFPKCMESHVERCCGDVCPTMSIY